MHFQFPKSDQKRLTVRYMTRRKREAPVRKRSGFEVWSFSRGRNAKGVLPIFYIRVSYQVFTMLWLENCKKFSVWGFTTTRSGFDFRKTHFESWARWGPTQLRKRLQTPKNRLPSGCRRLNKVVKTKYLLLSFFVLKIPLSFSLPRHMSAYRSLKQAGR